MDSPNKESENLRETNAVDTDAFASSPSVDLSAYIFSDAIKHAMESFTTAHQWSMAHMAEENATALVAAVDTISETLASRGGYTSVVVPSLPPSSAHNQIGYREKSYISPSTGTYGCLRQD